MIHQIFLGSIAENDTLANDEGKTSIIRENIRNNSRSCFPLQIQLLIQF